MEVKEILNKVADLNDLTYDEAYFMLDKIMRGEIEASQASCYLTALRIKGETVTEITASARGMRDNALKLLDSNESLDIVGTGGDRAFTFNISSISSFVIASQGIKVCKHGNRSVSSKCGSADIFEALGININVSEEKAKEILEKIGICFLFAQKYHSSMKNVGPIRKSLGIRTIFNILGPLTNPANARYMLLGVYDRKLVRIIAEALDLLGVEKALVVNGDDGLDEITLTGNTHICELRNHVIKEYDFNPTDYGFNLCKSEDLVGGSTEVNKKIALDVLNGVDGPKKDAVILNSGLAIYIASDDLSIQESLDIARDKIDSKEALKILNDYIKLSNEI